MKEVPLTRGYVALVDDDDYDRVMAAGSWCVRPSGQTAYAQRRIVRDGKGTTISLHQFLTGLTNIDHVNGDGLDNQRHNLRPATRGQNMGNRRLPQNSATGFKGVTKRKVGYRYQAQIGANGKHYYLGNFATAEEAARAYDAAAIRHFGEFARLNFPQEIKS